MASRSRNVDRGLRYMKGRYESRRAAVGPDGCGASSRSVEEARTRQRTNRPLSVGTLWRVSSIRRA